MFQKQAFAPHTSCKSLFPSCGVAFHSPRPLSHRSYPEVSTHHFSSLFPLVLENNVSFSLDFLLFLLNFIPKHIFLIPKGPVEDNILID